MVQENNGNQAKDLQAQIDIESKQREVRAYKKVLKHQESSSSNEEYSDSEEDKKRQEAGEDRREEGINRAIKEVTAGVTGIMEDLGLKKKRRKLRQGSDSFGLKQNAELEANQDALLNNGAKTGADGKGARDPAAGETNVESDDSEDEFESKPSEALSVSSRQRTEAHAEEPLHSVPREQRQNSLGLCRLRLHSHPID
jgi:hypothetical protein